jgi:hypothetical protein
MPCLYRTHLDLRDGPGDQAGDTVILTVERTQKTSTMAEAGGLPRLHRRTWNQSARTPVADKTALLQLYCTAFGSPCGCIAQTVSFAQAAYYLQAELRNAGKLYTAWPSMAILSLAHSCWRTCNESNCHNY